MSFEELLEELFQKATAITFESGFSLSKGDNCWIGSDGCEYEDPADYLLNGSPDELEQTDAESTL